MNHGEIPIDLYSPIAGRGNIPSHGWILWWIFQPQNLPPVLSFDSSKKGYSCNPLKSIQKDLRWFLFRFCFWNFCERLKHFTQMGEFNMPKETREAWVNSPFADCSKILYRVNVCDPPRVSHFSPQVFFWWLTGSNFRPLEDSGIQLIYPQLLRVYSLVFSFFFFQLVEGVQILHVII